MKRDSFVVELLKSPPVKILIILTLLIIIGIVIANRRERAVQMKEDILYVQPKPGS